LPASPASASLIFNSSIVLSAQGFGTAPRDLTLQATPSESGCVGVSGGGAIVIGASACLPNEVNVNDPNGVVNTGGDEPAPLADNQKYGIPKASDLGIDSADDIGVLFNPSEPSGNAANVTDVTLKFYDALTNALLGAIDGSQNFLSTDPGVGSAGFVFVVDALEIAYVNGLLSTPNGVRFALEATITGTAGGAESFLIANLNAPPPAVPEPSMLGLFGLCLVALGIVIRRRQTNAHPQPVLTTLPA
jgi:hypothetical protein